MGKRTLPPLPPGSRPEGLRLIAYVQDAATRAILGAGRTEVRP